jgi:hypothetical protein
MRVCKRVEHAMAVIWETVDRVGRKVGLTDERWGHILDRHGDMAGYRWAIRDAIELADEIARDMKHDHRQVHYRRRSMPPRWVRVAVHYRPIEPPGWAGFVVPAHLTNRRPKETRVWPLPNQSK